VERNAPLVEEIMSERIEHLDEGMIHAWIDGALSSDESARMESHANSCAGCAALVAEARGLVAASSRILASLDAVPAGVIPGSGAGTDQLAALRARRAADSRRWWRDRRFVAAASLVLVAGVSSVVWRTAGNQSPAAMEFTRAIDTVMPPAAAPSPGPAEAKADASQPLRDAAPVRVVTLPADSTRAYAKVGATGPVPTAVGAAVASSQQQTIDSTKALARGEQSAFERKVRQQVQTAPTPPRIIPEQQQAQDAARPAAPPPTAALSRNRSGVDAASFGAGFRLADISLVAGNCYRLQVVAPRENARDMSDTVRLLDEPVPERSDPSWLRARSTRAAAANAELTWRMADSVTVELRFRSSGYSSVVRFRTVAPVTSVPDVSGLSGVQAAVAERVDCR
jgi:hypothetical protein